MVVSKFSRGASESSLRLFLPKDAVVMARRRARPTLAEAFASLPPIELLFVCEAPLDEAGEELLKKMIEALGLGRSRVQISSIVKQELINHRVPTAAEITEGLPALNQQIRQLNPKMVIALGTLVAQALLNSDQKITDLRGQSVDGENGFRVMPIFQPAYLIRNPSAKREAWMDLQRVAKEIGIKIPAKAK